MRKILVLIIFLLLILLCYFLVRRYISYLNKPIHYHAGFLVYLDGKLQDFSSSKFMNLDVCSINQIPKSPQEIQKDKGHLHDNIGDIVHVHVSGAVWRDLFTNIGFKFPNNKEISGYVNGSKISDILNYPIKPYDSAIFIIGSSQGININYYVSKLQILEVEKKSESCSK